MKTTRQTKSVGASFQTHDRKAKYQMNFQTFKSGHLNNKQTEILMPTGANQKKEDKDMQVNQNQNDEVLYPTGFNPK